MTCALFVPFAQTRLVAVMEGSSAFVAMRPVVEGMGLDWKAQYRKIMADEVLASVVVEKATTGADGKRYSMLCLPVEYLQGWLFTVNPKRVKPAIRAKVIGYKRQCYHVLHAALMRQGRDRHAAIADKRAAARLVTDILQEVRAEQGKPCAPHHFSNEHRLCNAALTGRFGPIDMADIMRRLRRQTQAPGAIQKEVSRLLDDTLPMPAGRCMGRKEIT